MLDWAIITQIATCIAAVGGLLYGLWRYVVYPVYKLTIKLTQSSSELSTALPSLLVLADDYPTTPSNPNPLQTKLSRLERSIAFFETYLELLTRHFMGIQGPFVFFECDEAGRFIYVSDSWEHFTGASKSEALGWNWFHFIEKHNREYISENWEKNIQYRSHFHMDFSFWNKKTTSTIPVRVRVFIFNNPDKTYKIIGTFSYLNSDDNPKIQQFLK